MSLKIVTNITDLIGNTPIVKLNRLVPANAASVYVKLENFNAGGSIKDRIALNMINQAQAAGLIKPGDTLIEGTSGNTGVGIALVAAAKGYKTVIVMGEMASIERRKLMQAYGAELVIVPASAGGIQAVFDIVSELVKEKGYFPLYQFKNEFNPESHRLTTGPEILEAFQGHTPDAFVAGIGTGGTITGTGEYLRKYNPDIQIIAVEPDSSPVLSGGTPGPHLIQGIGAGIVPAILNVDIYNEIVRVTNEEAIYTARELATREGLLLGISSAAAIHAAILTAVKLGPEKSVLAIAPDTGERYLSTDLFQ